MTETAETEPTGIFGGKFLVIIVALVLVAAGAGAYFFLFVETPDENGDTTPLPNGGENGGGNGGGFPGYISPYFSFTWDDKDYNNKISVRETVTFNATASSGGHYYEWDFGDGFYDSANRTIVTHRYNAPGDYVVTLNLSTDDAWNTFSRNITVTEEQSPSIALTAMDVTPQTHNNTGLNWRITVSSSSGTAEQMAATSIQVRINRTVNDTAYFTSLVSELPTSPPTSPQKFLNPWSVNLTYDDIDGSQTVNIGDMFYVVGDGGLDIQDGDIFSVYFLPPEGAPIFLDSITIPAPP
ncbi:MAG: PKD domain-containing protein [Candidatus Thermoplasmatota archaeon]|nr:PKD domain-containing protein [Candidatus Thermoplasmatota archaeon]